MLEHFVHVAVQVLSIDVIRDDLDEIIGNYDVCFSLVKHAFNDNPPPQKKFKQIGLCLIQRQHMSNYYMLHF